MQKLPVLMTAENPDGWKLEDLAEQLANEIDAKTAKILGIDAPAAALYRVENARFARQLRDMSKRQAENIAFAAANPFTVGG